MHHMKTIRVWGLALLITCLLTESGFAQLVLDTGPGQNLSAQNIVFHKGNEFQSIAGRFEVKTTTHITGIQGYMSSGSAAPGMLVANITEGHSTLAPGSTLFSTGFTVAADFVPSWQGSLNLSWTLSPGDYWLVFSVPQDQPGFDADFPMNPAQALSTYSFKSELTDWHSDPSTWGLRIFGSPPASPVPEPSTYGASAALLLLAFSVIRRKSRWA